MVLARTAQEGRGIRSLTGVRGVAAVWVLSFHLQQNAGRVWGLSWLQGARVLERGWSGVDLFFVLSGFILMHAHGQDFSRIRVTPCWRFAKLRVVRVYPLSAVVLLLILALVRADTGFAVWYQGLAAGNLSLEAFVRTLFLATRWFLPGVGDWNQPVWSLSAEVLGYAAFPFVGFFLLQCRSFWTALLVGSVSLEVLAGAQFLLHSAASNEFGQISAVVRMALCFLAGAAFNRARRLAPSELLSCSSFPTIVALSMVAVSVASRQTAILSPLAYSTLIFVLSFERGFINHIFSSTPIFFLGRISFPLYLFHVMPLLWLQYHIAGRGLPEWLVVTILGGYIVACLLAATLLHYAVEKPCHALGRWTSQRPGSGSKLVVAAVEST